MSKDTEAHAEPRRTRRLRIADLNTRLFDFTGGNRDLFAKLEESLSSAP